MQWRNLLKRLVVTNRPLFLTWQHVAQSDRQPSKMTSRVCHVFRVIGFSQSQRHRLLTAPSSACRSHPTFRCSVTPVLKNACSGVWHETLQKNRGPDRIGTRLPSDRVALSASQRTILYAVAFSQFLELYETTLKHIVVHRQYRVVRSINYWINWMPKAPIFS